MADDSTPDAPEDGTDPDSEEGRNPTGEAGSEIKADDASNLGDAGKKALDEERKARRDAEKRIRKLEADLTKSQRATMDDDERKLAEAREAGAKDATEKATRRLFAAEARAAAAGKLANPNLLAKPDAALALLGLDEIPTDGDGDIDTEAISAAIDRLIESEPYLAGKATKGATPAGVPAGARGGAKSQLDRGSLQSMTPEEIVKAQSDGRLDSLLKGA